METYYLMTKKDRSALPRIVNEEHEFVWHPHQLFENVYVIQTIYSEQAMWKYIFGPNSLMSPMEDILTLRILLTRPDPNSFELLT